MKAIYTLFMFVFCINIFYAQNPFECMTISNDTTLFELKSHSFCSDDDYLSNYNLDKSGATIYDQTGIYTIRLKVHVMQYSSTDPRNYTVNDIPEILNAINGVNSIYSTIQSPSIPIVSPTLEESDTRIRFNLNPSDIEFVVDSTNYIGLKDSIHSINSTILEIIDNKTIIISGQYSGALIGANRAQYIIISGSNNNNDGWYRFETANVVIENNSLALKTEIKLLDALPDISDLTGTVNYSSYNYMYPNYHYIHNADDNSAIHIYFQKLGTQIYNNGFGATRGLNSNFLSIVNPQGQNGSIGYELLAHELGHCLGLDHTWDTPLSQAYINDISLPDNEIGDCNSTSISNNIMGYNTCRDYLSPLQIAYIRKQLNSSPTIMEKVIESQQATNNDVIITEPNTVWEKRELIGSNLIIEPNATLTIKCKVHFAPEAKVLIKPGGKLIIDGGLLTNDYNEYWRGIEVWGTSNQHQYPLNNSTYQGMLILKNDGTIENAHTAVTNWKRDDWNGIGGIIQATDGIFRNNRRDVEFMSYSNFLASNPSVKAPNLSFFRNTDFVSDDNFIEKGYAIQKHVTLWEVNGINFTNCHFSNDITTNKSNSSAPNGAISSLNAGFKVLAGCSTSVPLGQACPTSNLLKSSFSGFSSAVEIAGSSSTASVTVQQSEFTNNIFAIGVDEFDNVSINRNEIEIGSAGYLFSLPNLFVGSGINVDNSTGYIIEENHISTNASNGYHFGINVTNGGEDDHQLYKNKLNELSVGTVATGKNHNVNYNKGLQFLCNEYKNNKIGISIQSSPLSDGVRLYQGDFYPRKSSGNTFLNNTSEIQNAVNSIVYFYNGVNSEPINFTGQVLPSYATNANSCASNFGGGSIMQPLSLLKVNLGILSDDYNDLNFTLISQIDDGNTEQFKNNIEINWSDDAWHLREKLIEKSPYVSTDALLKAAEQNILPNGMLLEVLLANPDATRGEAFIENLRNETNNTFPEYMLDFVRNNWDTQTLRSNLEGQMATIHSELSKTRNYIKYLEKSEEEYTIEERLTTMKIGNSISHKIGLMDFYIENNQFTKADSVYQATLTDPATKNELNLIDYYDDYLTFRSSLSNRNLAQLDSSEIAYLQTLAENSGRAGGYAKNVLCFFYNICFEKEFPTEDLAPKNMLISTNSPELEDIMYNITLYPNPSDEFASIKWEIYDQIQNASYKVFDLNGLEVMSNVIDSNKGEKVIDTRSLKSGVYIVGIYNNDKIKVNKKLVVNPKK